MKVSAILSVLLSLASFLSTQEHATDQGLDFGDHSSTVLTARAWEAARQTDWTTASAFAEKCIALYLPNALEMQAALTEPAPGEKASGYWALNDVGTCYYILAQSWQARGDKKAAVESYRFLVEKLAFAQCWDKQGWFWKPAEAARRKLKLLEFEDLQ